MANKNKFTKTTVKSAIKGCQGNLTNLAKKLRVTRQTVYNYLEKYPDLKELVEQERESFVDVAESKLATLVNKGVPAAIFFTLETLGKKRGWTKRHEVTGADGEDLKFIFGGIEDPAEEDKAPSANPEPAL